MKKNFALCTTKKINILTLVLSKKKFGTKQKTISPPFKLNGRSLSILYVLYIFTKKHSLSFIAIYCYLPFLRERPFNLGVWVFFLKKYSDSQCC